jgi:hypothetical protein
MNTRLVLTALATVALGYSALIGAGVVGDDGRTAEAGSPYLNGQYWPNWAYLPLSTLPAYNCTTYDVSAGITAWNNTGLVSMGSPIGTSDCSGNDRVAFVYGQLGDYCAVCEGYVINFTIYRSVRNPETGAIGFLQIYRSEVYLKPGLPQLGPTTVAHELGHVVGLSDQYAGGENPYCSGGPASLMDLCGYATPQQQDIDWVTWEYRVPPAAPDSFNALVATFNRVNLTWVDRSHNERSFNIERTENSGPWVPTASVSRDGQSYAHGTSPNVSYCYRIRGVNDWGFVGAWAYSPCRTTPHALGIPRAAFGGYQVNVCWAAVSGSGATSYTMYYRRWNNGSPRTSIKTVSPNTTCYGANIGTWSLSIGDAYHFAVRACNSYGCSLYRDIDNNGAAYWEWIPCSTQAGCSGGGTGNTYYHSH